MQLTGKPELNRRVNRTLILDRIRTNGEVSRAELAKLTQIRPPTVTAIVRELLSDGLVVETGRGEARGGRAPRMVALSCARPQTIGFEITDTALLSGLADLKGRLHVRERMPYSPDTPERTIDRLTELAERTFAGLRTTLPQYRCGWSSLRGAGIALPGLIDAAKGKVRWSKPLGWRDVPLAGMCRERWNVPTDILNDSAAGSMAAHFFTEYQVQNLVYCVLRFGDATAGEVGVGIGLIIHGEPYHGEFGTAGEMARPVRHPLVDARDEHGQPYPDLPRLVQALRFGEPGAVAAMDRVGTDLGLLVFHAVNLLEPGRVIIESDVPELGEAFYQRLGQTLREYTLHHGGRRTELVLSTLEEYGGVRGAVVPALRRFFRLPSWT